MSKPFDTAYILKIEVTDEEKYYKKTIEIETTYCDNCIAKKCNNLTIKSFNPVLERQIFFDELLKYITYHSCAGEFLYIGLSINCNVYIERKVYRL